MITLIKCQEINEKKKAMSQQLVEVFATSEDTSPIFEKNTSQDEIENL